MPTGAGPPTTPAQVLDYWFREQPADPDSAMPQLRRWFEGGPHVDREIITRFAPTVDAAVTGGLVDWEAEPRNRLALIIVLDQYARSVYRNDPRAYAGDGRTLRLVIDGLDRGLDRGLSFWERLFFTMPLRHIEDPEVQRRGLAEARRLAADCPAPLGPIAAMGIEQSEKYLGVISRFGRFPHRNQVLGRTSTMEEETFLVDWAEKAPPRGMAADG